MKHLTKGGHLARRIESHKMPYLGWAARSVDFWSRFSLIMAQNVAKGLDFFPADDSLRIFLHFFFHLLFLLLFTFSDLIRSIINDSVYFDWGTRNNYPIIKELIDNAAFSGILTIQEVYHLRGSFNVTRVSMGSTKIIHLWDMWNISESSNFFLILEPWKVIVAWKESLFLSHLSCTNVGYFWECPR